jgi:agmatine/peptidylarginine deiminase
MVTGALVVATVLAVSISRADPRAIWRSDCRDAGPVFGESSVASAEFDPADAVVVAWDDNYASTFSAVVVAASQTADVYVLVNSEYDEDLARERMSWTSSDLSAVHFIERQFDSMWVRDYGPISVRLANGGYAMVDNDYSFDRPLDDEVPAGLAADFALPLIESELVLEGGNFLTNGRGLCVTTDKILEDNPELDQQEIACRMEGVLGCLQTVVLEALDGEETGHVDIFAKLVAEDTILLGSYSEEQDWVNAEVLDLNEEILEEVTLEGNRPLTVTRMPMPSNDDWLFRTYLNSLYINGTLIMPTYARDRDLEKEAIRVYRDTLPRGATIVTVDASKLIELEGAIHCVTQTFSYEQ